MALEKGYDIQKYIDIVEKGADYVADNFAWEAAGYWWYASGLNELVDSFTSDDINNVHKITNVVNRWTDTYEERQNNYIKLKKALYGE